MKKNLSNTLLATLALLLSAACSQDELAAPDTTPRPVSFALQLADVPQSRAIGDGTTATHLSYAVYEQGTDGTHTLRQSSQDAGAPEVTFQNKTATVELSLLTGRTYDIVFWADAYDKDATDAPYTLDFANQSLTVDYAKATANTDQGDAFYAVKQDFVAGTSDTQVSLARPFAQLNIGTDDLEAAGSLGIDTDNLQTYVRVSSLSTGMDLLSGELNGTTQDITFAAAALPEGTFPVANHGYLSLNYLLAADRSLHSCTLHIQENGSQPNSIDFGEVPIQRNYRTNIYGTLLTNKEGFTVKIDSDFEQPDYDQPHVVKTLDELQQAFAEGGTAILEQNIMLDNEPLTVKSGKTMVVDLNGHTLSNTGDIWGGNDWSLFSVDGKGSTLTLKGEGTVQAKEGDCYVADTRNGGKLVIESGTYIGNNHAIYCAEGEVEIKGGTFSIQQLSSHNDYRFLVNCLDRNYTAGTAKVTIRGGKFVGFNPANNLAEGANTNFLPKDGNYVSLKLTDEPVTNGTAYGTWEVKAYTNSQDFQSLIDSGASAIYLPKTASFNEANIVLDGGDKGVEIQGNPFYLSGANATFKGLTFNNGHNANKKGSAIYATENKCKNLTFENCTFKDAEWDALQLTDKDIESVTFKDCSFKNSVQGYRYIHLELIENGNITTNENAQVSITGCTFENVSNQYCKDSAITLAGFRHTNITLSGNTVKGSGAENITTNIIWICDGNDFNTLIPAEDLKTYFVYEP